MKTKRNAPEGAIPISFPDIKITVSFSPVKDNEQPSLFPETETSSSDTDKRELVHLSGFERMVFAHLEPSITEEQLLTKLHTRNWKKVSGALHRLKAKGAISFFIEDGMITSERLSKPSCREPNSVDLFDWPISACRMYH